MARRSGAQRTPAFGLHEHKSAHKCAWWPAQVLQVICCIITGAPTVVCFLFKYMWLYSLTPANRSLLLNFLSKSNFTIFHMIFIQNEFHTENDFWLQRHQVIIINAFLMAMKYAFYFLFWTLSYYRLPLLYFWNVSRQCCWWPTHIVEIFFASPPL